MTPPLVVESPVFGVQDAKSSPTADSATLPSVDPSVSHESYCSSGMAATKAGSIPPKSTPVAACQAGGITIGLVLSPYIE